MGILDAPAYSRPQADALFRRATRRMSLAGLGDSLLNNGAPPMAVLKLAANAASGATSMSVTAPQGSGNAPATQMTNDVQTGILVQVGNEFVKVASGGSYTGAGPYTVPVTALANAHTAGEPVITRPMSQSNANGDATGSSPVPTFWAAALSQGQLRYGGTYGHGGYTPQELRDIYLPLVIQAKPGFCAVQAGRNRNTSATTLAQSIAIVVEIWDRLIAAGITPIGMSLAPSDSQKQDDAYSNAVLRSAAAKRGIPFADYHSAVTDPATSTWISGWSGDTVHPRPGYYSVVGQTIWNAVKPFLTGPAISPLPDQNAYLDTTVYPLVAAQTNAKMLNGGGNLPSGTSSVLPGGWESGALVDSTAIITRPDAPRGGGKSIKISRAAGATPSTSIFNNSSQWATLVNGHTYRAMLNVKIVGLTAAAAATTSSRVTIGFTDTGAGSDTTFGYFGPLFFDIDGTLIWDFIKTPAQPAASGFRIVLQGAAASTAYTVEVWDANIIDLTAIGEQTDFPIAFAA